MLLRKSKENLPLFSLFVLIEFCGFSLNWYRLFRDLPSGKSVHTFDFNKEGKSGELWGKITLKARIRNTPFHSVMFDGTIEEIIQFVHKPIHFLRKPKAK